MINLIEVEEIVLIDDETGKILETSRSFLNVNNIANIHLNRPYEEMGNFITEIVFSNDHTVWIKEPIDSFIERIVGGIK